MEARDANLSAKTHLKHLELNWSDTDWSDRREEANVSVEEEVLESLVPSTGLTHLQLSNYWGVSYPSWIKSTKNLVDIYLINLRRLERIPPLGQLPSLKYLYIQGLDSITRIGEEFYGEARGDNIPFRMLEELKLFIMKNLEEWVVEAGDIKREKMFPCLKKLGIKECPKLRNVQPGLPVSVVDLDIWVPLELSDAAESLSGMNRVRELNITLLKAASSSFCWEGLIHLTALECLKIYDCYEMRCLPEGLIHLHIPTLRTLDIYGCDELTSLAEAHVQQQQPPLFFTSLHHLTISGCSALTALPEWLGGLTSLQSLSIEYCHKLEMLPDGLQHLTALQQLKIKYCDILEKRCIRETGEDWHKIAHIPHIQIIPRYRHQPEPAQQQQHPTSTIRRQTRGGLSNLITWIQGGCMGPSITH